MDKTEIKNLDTKALSKEVSLLKRELFNLKLSSMTGQVKDVSQFKKLRRKIAQSQTFLKQKLQAKEVAKS